MVGIGNQHHDVFHLQLPNAPPKKKLLTRSQKVLNLVLFGRLLRVLMSRMRSVSSDDNKNLKTLSFMPASIAEQAAEVSLVSSLDMFLITIVGQLETCVYL